MISVVFLNTGVSSGRNFAWCIASHKIRLKQNLTSKKCVFNFVVVVVVVVFVVVVAVVIAVVVVV